MSIGMYEPGYGESTLLPRKIREKVLFKERVVRPDMSLNMKSFRNDSPFVSNLKIKEILGLSQGRSSVLGKYRVKKVMTNKIIQKHLGIKSWVLPCKKFGILPKIRAPSVDRVGCFLGEYGKDYQKEDKEEEKEKGQGEGEEGEGYSISRFRTNRKIILSRLGHQSFELINNPVNQEPNTLKV